MTAEFDEVNAPLSWFSPQAQVVSSFDFVSCQKSVSLSGCWGKCRGTDDVKEGKLPSCLSNSNLKQSSLTNTPGLSSLIWKLQLWEEVQESKRFPTWGKASVSTCWTVQPGPTATILPLRQKTGRSYSPSKTLRAHRPLHSCPDSLTAWGPTVSSNICPGLPNVYQELHVTTAATTCQAGKDHHLYLAYASIFKSKGEWGPEREYDLFTVIVVKT